MSLKEKIQDLSTVKPLEKMAQQLTPKLQRIIDTSGILGVITQLHELTPFTEKRDIIENGTKMCIDIQWGENSLTRNRMVISVTENALSFMGNDEVYERLTGQQITDLDLVEKSFARIYLNPQKIETTTK